MTAALRSGRHRMVALALAIAATMVALVVDQAQAQQVVARVNGDPITAVDIAQRKRLIELSTHKAPSQKEVLDELIDEQLKIQAARRYRLEITEAEVDNVVANMATRMRTDAQQFAKALSGSGVSINALRRKLRADLAWNQIVRGKFQNNLIVADKDIAAAVQSRKKDDKAAVEYTLRPILLLVPRGAGDAAIESRRREADALRTRFQNCDDGVKLARGLKDVAVREPLTRSSADLGAKLRELLDGMEIGRLTPPDITPQGVEVFALCAKKQAKGDTGAERDVREELFGERFQAQGKKYLQELRRSAMIETK
jgi:peptidyl-prolyl cis-trans isomerase SurA